MLCPKCSADDLKVLETRAGKVASTRRRRECLECGHRFSTIEEVLREDLAVVKRDGRRESFDRTKLAMGLRRAIAKRPIDAEQINGLLSETLRRMENEYDSEVPSRAIADAIMLRLRKVDSIAWLRYASFYEDFVELSRFAEEILNLGGGEKSDEDGG
ncbi:MAG: transcriptional regulator NrdR [Opitutae bacterium]|jgi:transcriptional repressor NrdR|nr:transcriptional regulator NrdR [Opitutae bacterium]|tara:strand:- start:88 stop:561 length:474 start_codon:yes stop_codon:yes gene_type:complete